MVPVGMAETSAANFGQKDAMIAYTAARRMTQRIIHAGQRQNAGVLAVGGVGRRAEEGRDGRGQTVAQQGAVQARIGDEVFADGGGDGADIADVLDHGRKRDGHDGDDGGDEQVEVSQLPIREKTVFSIFTGRPIHAALATPEKSTGR